MRLRSLVPVVAALSLTATLPACSKKDAGEEEGGQKKADLSGNFIINPGVTPAGKAYQGTVVLKLAKEFYTIEYTPQEGAPYKGVGLQEGDFVAGVSAPAGEFGLVLYHVNFGNLFGKRVTSAADGVAGETLKGPEGVNGTYEIVETKGPGPGYKGTVNIKPNGEVHEVDWQLEGGKTLTGIGIVRGNVFLAAYGEGVTLGVYGLQGGSLIGKTYVRGSATAGQESLMRK
jgi:hypothetical protein